MSYPFRVEASLPLEPVEDSPRSEDEDAVDVVADGSVEPLPRTWHNFNRSSESWSFAMLSTFAKRNPRTTILAVLACVSGIIALIYGHAFLAWLEGLAVAVRNLGFRGHLLIFFIIFCSAFPPIVGYSTYVMLSGFTFGFTVGLVVAYTAALIGGTLCFLLARRYLQRYIRAWFKRYRHLETVLRAVEKRGLKLLVLIRVAPYPYNIMNVLLATTTVSTGTFILGTALSLIKIALHVFIGANLTSFTRPNENEDPTMHTVRIAVMIAGFVFGLAVMLYMYRLTQKLVNEVAVDEGLQEAEEGLLGDEWGWEEDAFLGEEEEEPEEAIVHPTNHT